MGTFAGHTGHRLFASFVVERVPPQGAPTRWEPKGTKRKKVADKEQTDSINSGLYEAKHGASSSVNSQGGHLNLPAPPPGLTEQDRTDRLRCYPTLSHVCCPHHKSCRYCEATCCRTDPAHTSHRCRVHLHW